MSSRYRRVMIESDSEDEVEFNRGFEEIGLLPSEEEHASLLVKRVATAVMLTDGDQLLAPTQTEFELDIGKLKKVYSLIVNDTTLRPFLFPELYQPAVVTMELAEVDLVHTNLNDMPLIDERETHSVDYDGETDPEISRLPLIDFHRDSDNVNVTASQEQLIPYFPSHYDDIDEGILSRRDNTPPPSDVEDTDGIVCKREKNDETDNFSNEVISISDEDCDEDSESDGESDGDTVEDRDGSVRSDIDDNGEPNTTIEPDSDAESDTASLFDVFEHPFTAYSENTSTANVQVVETRPTSRREVPLTHSPIYIDISEDESDAQEQTDQIEECRELGTRRPTWQYISEEESSTEDWTGERDELDTQDQTGEHNSEGSSDTHDQNGDCNELDTQGPTAQNIAEDSQDQTGHDSENRVAEQQSQGFEAGDSEDSLDVPDLPLRTPGDPDDEAQEVIAAMRERRKYIESTFVAGGLPPAYRVDEVVKRNIEEEAQPRIVANKRPKTVPCTQCSGLFVDDRGLENHVRRVHLGEKRVACELCNFSSFDPTEVTYHKRDKHTHNHPHRCEYCEVGFNRVSTYLKHKEQNKNGECRARKRRKSTASSPIVNWIQSDTYLSGCNGRYRCKFCVHCARTPEKVLQHIVEDHPEIEVVTETTSVTVMEGADAETESYSEVSVTKKLSTNTDGLASGMSEDSSEGHDADVIVVDVDASGDGLRSSDVESAKREEVPDVSRGKMLSGALSKKGKHKMKKSKRSDCHSTQAQCDTNFDAIGKGSTISNTLVNNDDAFEDAPDLNTKAPHTEGHTSKPVMMTAFETVSIHPIHSTKTDQIRSPSTNPDEWKESNLVISADTDPVIPEQTDPVDSADTSMSTNCSERSDESSSDDTPNRPERYNKYASERSHSKKVIDKEPCASTTSVPSSAVSGDLRSTGTDGARTHPPCYKPNTRTITPGYTPSAHTKPPAGNKPVISRSKSDETRHTVKVPTGTLSDRQRHSSAGKSMKQRHRSGADHVSPTKPKIPAWNKAQLVEIPKEVWEAPTISTAVNDPRVRDNPYKRKRKIRAVQDVEAKRPRHGFPYWMPGVDTTHSSSTSLILFNKKTYDEIPRPRPSSVEIPLDTEASVVVQAAPFIDEAQDSDGSDNIRDPRIQKYSGEKKREETDSEADRPAITAVAQQVSDDEYRYRESSHQMASLETEPDFDMSSDNDYDADSGQRLDKQRDISATSRGRVGVTFPVHLTKAASIGPVHLSRAAVTYTNARIKRAAVSVPEQIMRDVDSKDSDGGRLVIDAPVPDIGSNVATANHGRAILSNRPQNRPPLLPTRIPQGGTGNISRCGNHLVANLSVTVCNSASTRPAPYPPRTHAIASPELEEENLEQRRSRLLCRPCGIRFFSDTEKEEHHLRYHLTRPALYQNSNCSIERIGSRRNRNRRGRRGRTNPTYSQVLKAFNKKQ